MKVAIVGATGNVGSALIRALERDERVREVVGIARRVPEHVPPKVVWKAADVGKDAVDGGWDETFGAAGWGDC